MPVVINELSTSFQVRDEARVKKLVQKEVEMALKKSKRGGGDGKEGPDPTDPAAGGAPQAQGGS